MLKAANEAASLLELALRALIRCLYTFAQKVGPGLGDEAGGNISTVGGRCKL
jgi:hypothetical protein